MTDRVGPDNWTPTVWTQPAVMDMTARLDPGRIAHYADDWQRAVDAIRDVFVELNRRLTEQLGQSWRGQGADAAAAAVREYITGSIDGLVACRSVAVHLYELSQAAGDLRACITASGGSPDDVLGQVRTLYSAPAVAAGNAVVDIPPPPEPFGLADQPATGALAEVAPAASTSPAAVGPAGSAPLDTMQWGSGPGNQTGAPAYSSPGADPYVTTPFPTRLPIHTTALSSSPSDTLGPRLENPATTTASPADATASSPAHASASRVAAGPVSPLLGAAYPGYGARADPAEHRTPRYLMSAGYTNELVGELPMVAPPVIGE